MTDLLTVIFQTHLSSWADCQQLHLILFNTEDHCHILDGAQPWIVVDSDDSVVDSDAWMTAALGEHRESKLGLQYGRRP